MAAVEISLVEKAVSCLFWHFESLFTNFLNKILNWIFWTIFWMNFWLNEYFKFCFELNIELNHFWARFNVWLNNRNVSDRATKRRWSLQLEVAFSSPTCDDFVLLASIYAWARLLQFNIFHEHYLMLLFAYNLHPHCWRLIVFRSRQR